MFTSIACLKNIQLFFMRNYIQIVAVACVTGDIKGILSEKWARFSEHRGTKIPPPFCLLCFYVFWFTCIIKVFRFK